MPTVRWQTRAVPRGNLPYREGAPAEWFEIEMTDVEFKEMQRVTRLVAALPVGPDRSAMVNEIAVQMELRCLLGARLLTKVEQRARGLIPAGEAKLTRGAQAEGPIQTTFLEPEGTSTVFKIPEKARRKLGLTDRDNIGTGQARARRDDPDTSHAAAASISPDELRASQRAVLDCFDRYGPMHDELFVARYEEIRDAHGWPSQSVSGLRSRRDELVDGGLMIDTGRTVVLQSGRSGKVWHVNRRQETA